MFTTESEGWGRYCIHRCLSVHMGGTPSPSHNTSTGPMSFPGGTPVPGEGVPQYQDELPPLPQPGQSGQDGVPSRKEQQIERLLHGGRYASNVHAEGLSCLK